MAHGEGRAEFATAEDLQQLNQRGQVALNYVDSQHQLTERYPHNPNGASQGLAGLTAADGRVLLMMPHPERGCSVAVKMSWLTPAGASMGHG